MVWTSPYEPVETWAETLPRAGRRDGARPGDPALIDAPRERRSPSRAGVAHRRRGGRPGARGFGPGEVLAVWAPNPPEWIVALGRDGSRRGRDRREPAGGRSRARGAADRLRRVGAGDGSPAGVARPRRRARSVEVLAPEQCWSEAAAPDGPVDPEARRSAALLERDDRHAQGRNAHPLEPRHRGAPARRLVRLGEHDVVLAVAPFSHVMGFVVSGIAPSLGCEPRHRAALRLRAGPRARRAPPRDRARRPAAGHGRARDAPTGRPLRPRIARARHLRRGAAPRRAPGRSPLACRTRWSARATA